MSYNTIIKPHIIIMLILVVFFLTCDKGKGKVEDIAGYDNEILQESESYIQDSLEKKDNKATTELYFKKAYLGSKYEIVGLCSIEDHGVNNDTCYIFVYDAEGKLLETKYIKDGELHNDDYFGVARILIEYSDGFETRTFMDSYGDLMADEHGGVYSIKLELNDEGYPFALYNYDENGNLTEDRYGVTKYLWDINEDEERIRSVFLDRKGDRIFDNRGIYEIYWVWLYNGNLLQGYFGADKVMTEIDNNVALEFFTYNEKECLIEKETFSIEDLKDHFTFIFEIYELLCYELKDFTFEFINIIEETDDPSIIAKALINYADKSQAFEALYLKKILSNYADAFVGSAEIFEFLSNTVGKNYQYNEAYSNILGDFLLTDYISKTCLSFNFKDLSGPSKKIAYKIFIHKEDPQVKEAYDYFLENKNFMLLNIPFYVLKYKFETRQMDDDIIEQVSPDGGFLPGV